MAKITPIDVIKGISGKYGHGSNDYFATNSSSNKIHLAKFSHPYEGEPTAKQLAQQERFKARQAVATAWLNANKPSETNGAKGTDLYQLVQRIKRQLGLSCITQVLYRYMDETNRVVLPVGGVSAPGTGGETPTGTGGETPTGGGGTAPTGGGGTAPGSGRGDDDEMEHN